MRWLVFSFDDYYPEGGANDLKLATNDADEAYDMWLKLLPLAVNVQVYDTVKGELVYCK